MNPKLLKIITRFAPSPTGVLHIGSVRTALYNCIYARQHGGTFILRIEDTDTERSKKEYEENIIDGLKWLGIDYDIRYRQSDRCAIYKKYLEILLANGAAYISDEIPTEGGSCTQVIRFKNPNTTITFHDEVRGDISYDTTELGNFVIAKDLERPVFHFALVVDDFEMGITHVIRGDDHISNTPRQILIQQALNAPRPLYIHLPMLLSSDRSKLSKRYGAIAVTEYHEQGYIPEALLNFVALMGWNPGNDQEILSCEEMKNLFSFEKIQKSGAVFSIDKLNWLNKQYLKLLPTERIEKEILARLPPVLSEKAVKNPELFKKIIPIIINHITIFSDVRVMVDNGDLTFFFESPEYNRDALLWKDELDHAIAAKKLSVVIKIIETLDPTQFTADTIKAVLWDYATTTGRGSVLWPMRYALSGKAKSPDPFTLASILGKEITIQRIKHAVEILGLGI